MCRPLVRVALTAWFLALFSGFADAQTPPPLLAAGDLVVTGFAGVQPPDPARPLPPGKTIDDLTFIDPDGISARLFDPSRPGYVWDGRVYDAPEKLAVPAKTVGQVFGVAIDDAIAPNAYLAATSAFGLNLAAPLPDRTLERRKTGGPGTLWMPGQFGTDLRGGPGSIYKVDGVTGAVSLFAQVALNGRANPGAALGNLAFDAAHQQLFVSDLHTGMVHRLAIRDGREAGPAFDHGTAGRTAAGLPPVPYDPAFRVEITDPRFKSEDPASWGYAPAPRRVWGLALHEGRLFYSVGDGADGTPPQIWSVGLTRDGGFAGDPRWELDVSVEFGAYAVSDIVFSHKGAMILAQRTAPTGSYDYLALTQPGEPRVLRYWLEDPNDPATPSRWIKLPEEYAVGFAGPYRNANGGVDLGYGYDEYGVMTGGACEYALWATGQQLRNDPSLREWMEPGGPLAISGLQGSPAGPVRGFNAPPEASYFIDFDRREDDPRIAGHLGGVRVVKVPCVPPVAWYGGPGYPAEPPYVYVETVVWPPVVVISACPWPLLPNGTCGFFVEIGCPWGFARDGLCWPVLPDCLTNPDPRLCGATEIDLKLDKVAGKSVRDPTTGLWTIDFTLAVTNAGAPFAPGGSITLTDAVPAGMVFAAAAGTNWSCAPALPISTGSLSCTHAFGPGTFGTGQIADPLTITATVKDPGKYENCGLVGVAPAAGLRETTLDNNRSCAGIEVKTDPKVDVKLVKTGKIEAAAPAGPAPAAGAATLTYTLTPTNVGPGFTGANAITITDTVPAGLTFTAVAGGADWTCGAAPIAAGATLTCTYVGAGPAAAGDALGAITITATAAGPGPWENCATAAIAPASGVDSNLADNTSCVTLKDDGFDVVEDPPEVPKVCGMNVIFVVDESGSVGTSAGTVQGALNNAANLFRANGSQAALIHFSDSAQTVLPMAATTYSSIATGYAPFGGTNWEAGLAAALTLLPGPPPGTVVVFITDGVPNAYLDAAGTTQYTDSVTATNEAIPVVNQLYAAGVPVIGIGIGSLSTHLNALLGGNVLSSSFGTLNSTLTGLAREMCPGLYLTKSISPTYINMHTNPVTEVTVTLSLTNTAGALTNVVVQDDLPPQLTTPSNPVATSNPASVPPTSAVVGDPVVWTIPTLAAGGTATLSFKVTLAPTAPIPTNGTWLCMKNYAQVTAVGTGTVGHVPNNMANAETGPVHEPDEASGQVCLQDYVATPPEPCSAPYLWVKKTTLNEVCRPGGEGGIPCSFKVTVTARCMAFDGPVLFGDGVFASGTATPLPIASITAAPPVACTWGGTTPATCAVPNFQLALNQSVTFTVTLGSPVPPGTYSNCFVADGLAPVATDFPTAHGQINPNSSSNGGNWGHCAPFLAAAAAPMVAGCPAGQAFIAGRGCVAPPPKTCAAPLVLTPKGTCECPPGSVQRGRECVKVPTCAAPLVLSPRGTCECPPGSTPRGRECVRPPACAAPLVMTPMGTCECPPGSIQRGRECVRPPACSPPLLMTPKGTCECPPGSIQRGRECVRPPACAPPLLMTPKGTCECPPGSVQRGRECVKAPACAPPRMMTPTGACECPPGTIQRGRECVKAPACAPPLLMTPKGTCECPPGSIQRGRECVKAPACAPPLLMTPKGTCECPPGTIQRGRECVKAPACAPPRMMTPKGTCECPPGTIQRGRECVKPNQGPTLACRPPAVPNAAGTQCVCPSGTQMQGDACRPVARPPTDVRRPDVPQTDTKGGAVGTQGPAKPTPSSPANPPANPRLPIPGVQ